MGERMARAIDMISTNMLVDRVLIDNVQKIYHDKGVDAAELYITQTTTSQERDELLRILIVCHNQGLSPVATFELIKNLNRIESGVWTSPLDESERRPSVEEIIKNKAEMAKVIKRIGVTTINIDLALIAGIREILLKNGFEEAALYITQSTASQQRDELLRVLFVCLRQGLSPSDTAELLRVLNKIESGAW